jgi:hypothetical protein
MSGRDGNPGKEATGQTPLRIVAGGQTGVDRAALDVALRLRLPCGGWCPRGRRAEDGPLDPRYPLVETPSPDYAQRTEWNVRDADATLILSSGPMRGGTALTARLAREREKPVLALDLDEHPEPRLLGAFVAAHAVRVLNVAGPRESQSPGIYERAARFLEAALSSTRG